MKGNRLRKGHGKLGRHVVSADVKGKNPQTAEGRERLRENRQAGVRTDGDREKESKWELSLGKEERSLAIRETQKVFLSGVRTDMNRERYSHGKSP